jgi:hypothetical protein
MVTGRVAEHLIKLDIRQPIQAIVRVEQIYVERKAHQVSACAELTRAACRLIQLAQIAAAWSPRLGDSNIVVHFNLVIMRRVGLPGNTGEATQTCLRRTNDPDRRSALTMRASPIGTNCELQLPLQFSAIRQGIGTDVQFDIVI